MPRYIDSSLLKLRKMYLPFGKRHHLNNYKNQNFDALNKYFDGKVTFTDDLTMHGQLDAADKAMAKLFLDRLTDIDFEVLTIAILHLVLNIIA